MTLIEVEVKLQELQELYKNPPSGLSKDTIILMMKPYKTLKWKKTSAGIK